MNSPKTRLIAFVASHILYGWCVVLLTTWYLQWMAEDVTGLPGWQWFRSAENLSGLRIAGFVSSLLFWKLSRRYFEALNIELFRPIFEKHGIFHFPQDGSSILQRMDDKVQAELATAVDSMCERMLQSLGGWTLCSAGAVFVLLKYDGSISDIESKWLTILGVVFGSAALASSFANIFIAYASPFFTPREMAELRRKGSLYWQLFRRRT